MGGPERAATPPPLYGDGVYAVGADDDDDDDGDDALIVMMTVMTIFSSGWYDTPRRLHPRAKAPPAVRSPKAGVSREKLTFEDYFSKVHFF